MIDTYQGRIQILDLNLRLLRWIIQGQIFQKYFLPFINTDPEAFSHPSLELILEILPLNGPPDWLKTLCTSNVGIKDYLFLKFSLTNSFLFEFQVV